MFPARACRRHMLLILLWLLEGLTLSSCAASLGAHQSGVAARSKGIENTLTPRSFTMRQAVEVKHGLAPFLPSFFPNRPTSPNAIMTPRPPLTDPPGKHPNGQHQA